MDGSVSVHEKQNLVAVINQLESELPKLELASELSSGWGIKMATVWICFKVLNGNICISNLQDSVSGTIPTDTDQDYRILWNELSGCVGSIPNTRFVGVQFSEYDQSAELRNLYSRLESHFIPLISKFQVLLNREAKKSFDLATSHASALEINPELDISRLLQDPNFPFAFVDVKFETTDLITTRMGLGGDRQTITRMTDGPEINAELSTYEGKYLDIQKVNSNFRMLQLLSVELQEIHPGDTANWFKNNTPKLGTNFYDLEFAKSMGFIKKIVDYIQFNKQQFNESIKWSPLCRDPQEFIHFNRLTREIELPRCLQLATDFQQREDFSSWHSLCLIAKYAVNDISVNEEQRQLTPKSQPFPLHSILDKLFTRSRNIPVNMAEFEGGPDR
jgi:hypothetical protein